jgi:hypothetical protein
VEAPAHCKVAGRFPESDNGARWAPFFMWACPWMTPHNS